RQERVDWLTETGELSWGGEEWCCDQNIWPIGLFDRLLDKHAVCFVDSSRINKQVNEICKSLELSCGSPTDAHIFYSRNPENKSFSAHWDWSSNIICQFVGTSHIKVYSNIPEEIDNEHRTWENQEEDLEVVYSEDMEPGDIAYVPAQTFHYYNPTSKRLSISFPMNPNSVDKRQQRQWIEP
ncbi:MAG: cupin domain-containing protein, partial [Candidatus Poseidoniales archaeon]